MSIFRFWFWQVRGLNQKASKITGKFWIWYLVLDPAFLRVAKFISECALLYVCISLQLWILEHHSSSKLVGAGVILLSQLQQAATVSCQSYFSGVRSLHQWPRIALVAGSQGLASNYVISNPAMYFCSLKENNLVQKFCTRFSMRQYKCG